MKEINFGGGKNSIGQFIKNIINNNIIMNAICMNVFNFAAFDVSIGLIIFDGKNLIEVARTSLKSIMSTIQTGMMLITANPRKANPVRNLSASGSKNFPNFDCAFNLLANHPSK